MAVDSYAYLDAISTMVMKAWVRRERAMSRDVPWTPLPKPLEECRLALLTSAGIALRADEPFDQQGERDDPWWGDPTHRVVPARTQAADCEVYHLHVDATAPRKDLNVCFPLDRAAELAAEGVVGSLAPSHYSIMGYLLRVGRLLDETVPKIVARLRAEEVDVVLLVPV